MENIDKCTTTTLDSKQSSLLINVKNPFSNIFRFIREVIDDFEEKDDCYISITLGKKIFEESIYINTPFHPFNEIIEEPVYNKKLETFKKWCSMSCQCEINRYTNHSYYFKDMCYTVKYEYTLPVNSIPPHRECIKTKWECTKDFIYEGLSNVLEARVSTSSKIEESLAKLPHNVDHYIVEDIIEFNILAFVKVLFYNTTKKIKTFFKYNSKTITKDEKEIIITVLKVLWFNNTIVKLNKPISFN